MEHANRGGWWCGRTVIDLTGGVVGTIDDVRADVATGEPEWLVVRVERLGAVMVPLVGSRPRGEEILVPFTRSEIRDAPRLGVRGWLSDEDEMALYAYYGVVVSYERSGTLMPERRQNVHAEAPPREDEQMASQPRENESAPPPPPREKPSAASQPQPDEDHVVLYTSDVTPEELAAAEAAERALDEHDEGQGRRAA